MAERGADHRTERATGEETADAAQNLAPDAQGELRQPPAL
jgi:hypothetical protein